MDIHALLDTALDSAIEGRSEEAMRICDEIGRHVRTRKLPHVDGDQINRRYPHFVGQADQIRKAHWYLNQAIFMATTSAPPHTRISNPDLFRALENMGLVVSNLYPEHSDRLEKDSPEMRQLAARFSDEIGESSGYVTTFGRPEPMDPNDRLRQQTQSRGDVFPYDRAVSHGASSHAGMDGSEREDGASSGPPLARQHRSPRPMSVWDRMSDAIDRELDEDLKQIVPLRNGPDTELASYFGYGSHGRMGEAEGLSLLDLLDPEETADPDGQDEARDTYGCWAGRVIGREE